MPHLSFKKPVLSYELQMHDLLEHSGAPAEAFARLPISERGLSQPGLGCKPADPRYAGMRVAVERIPGLIPSHRHLVRSLVEVWARTGEGRRLPWEA